MSAVVLSAVSGRMSMTWSKAIRVQRLELLNEALEFALRATGNGPFEVGRELRDDVLAGVLSSETGSAEDDELVLARRHDVAELYLDTQMQKRVLLV
jgi:hypothetical protein